MTTLLRILLVAPLLCGCNYFSHASDKQTESGATAPIPKVATVKVARKSLQRTTTQPGEIQAFEAAPLYAKASGYVEKVHVDIGDAVKQGDLLVTLYIPEVQQELKGKEAQLAVA